VRALARGARAGAGAWRVWLPPRLHHVLMRLTAACTALLLLLPLLP
jgi:hypothetical protein